MELIRISDSKLKIMLSEEDMRHYAMTSDMLDYENTETRRAVWQILDEVKQKCGFDAAADRVLIQVYPSREGGCEMYVTKVMPQAPKEEETMPVRREGRLGLYVFPDLSAFLRACRQLACLFSGEESTAYVTEDGRYYLLMREGGEQICGSAAYNPAEEFGEKQKATAARMAYIKEHATCIAPRAAIPRMADLL